MEGTAPLFSTSESTNSCAHAQNFGISKETSTCYFCWWSHGSIDPPYQSEADVCFLALVHQPIRLNIHNGCAEIQISRCSDVHRTRPANDSNQRFMKEKGRKIQIPINVWCTPMVARWTYQCLILWNCDQIQELAHSPGQWPTTISATHRSIINFNSLCMY